MQKLPEYSAVPVAFIYKNVDIMAITNRKEWLHFKFPNDIEYTNFQLISK